MNKHEKINYKHIDPGIGPLMPDKNQYSVKDLDHSTVSFKYYSRKKSKFSTSSKWKEFTALKIKPKTQFISIATHNKHRSQLSLALITSIAS